MTFERFELGASRGFAPKISIRAAGQLGFNQGAVKRFELEKYSYAVLFYDKEDNRMAIQPTNERNEKGLMKLRVRDNGKDAAISIKAFLDYYGIEYKKTRSMEAYWDENEKKIIVDLGRKTDTGGDS